MISHADLQEKLQENRSFTGAEAHLSQYKAIYQMDQSDPAVVKKALKNILNLLEDPRLRGKVQVELVTFSNGTEILLKNSGYEEQLKDLIGKGVIVAQCINSLAPKKLSKEQFYDFVAFIPSGNGELVIRASEGWVIIKP